MEGGKGKEARAFPIWDCGSSLYDSHELVSLAYTIERHMIVWPYLNLGGPKHIFTQFYDPEDVSSTQNVPKGSSMATSCLSRQRMKKKHKKTKSRFSGFYDCGGNRLQVPMNKII
ncbi:hypothetical protein SESBI_19280 [Sesbania bispinosa]|nr:hypothetical protein SESBI_19280 [Sesbania bispinosa]